MEGSSKPPVRRRSSLKCTLKTKAVPHGLPTRKKSDSRPPKLLIGLASELQNLKLRRVQQSCVGESSPSPEVMEDEHLHTPSTWKQKFSPGEQPSGLNLSKSSPNLLTLSKSERAVAKHSSQKSQETDKVRGSKPAVAKKPVFSVKNTPSPPISLKDSNQKAFHNPASKLTSNSPNGSRTPPVLPTKPKVLEKPKGNKILRTKDPPKDLLNVAVNTPGSPSPTERSPESRNPDSNFYKRKALFESRRPTSPNKSSDGKSPNSPVPAPRNKSPLPSPRLSTVGAPKTPEKPDVPVKSSRKVDDTQTNVPDTLENKSRKRCDTETEMIQKSLTNKNNRSSDSSAYDDVMISDGSDSECGGKVRVTVTASSRLDCLIGDTDSGHGSTISTDEVGIGPNLDVEGERSSSEWVDETPPSPTQLNPQLRYKNRTPSQSYRHSTDLSTRKTRRGITPKSRFWSNPEKTISILSTSPQDDYDDVVLPWAGGKGDEWETDSETSDVDKSASLPSTEAEGSVSAPDDQCCNMDPVIEDTSRVTPLPEPPPKPTRAAIDIPILPPRRGASRTSPYGSPKLSPRDPPYYRRESPRVSPRNSPVGSPHMPKKKISLDSNIPAPLLAGVSRSRDGSGQSDNSGSSGDVRGDSPPPAVPQRRGLAENTPAPALPSRQKTTKSSTVREKLAPPLPPRESAGSNKQEGTPPPTPPRVATIRLPDLKPDTIVPLSPEARDAALKEKEEHNKPMLPPRRKTAESLTIPNSTTLYPNRTQRSQSTTNLLRVPEPSLTLSPSDNSMLAEVPPPPPVRSRNRSDEYVGPDPPLPDAPPIPNNGYLVMNAIRTPCPRPPRDNYIDPSEIDSLPFNKSTSETPEPFRDLWRSGGEGGTSEANYLTILPAEGDECDAAFVVERSSSKRFTDEPLYQIYHCGAVARDVLEQHHDEDGQSDEEDLYPEYQEEEEEEGARPESPTDIYSTWEELANSTPSPDVMASKLQNLIKTSTGVRTLWCEMPEVRESGILSIMPLECRKFQEALFEVITSEASYLKSLNLLITHFKSSSALQPPLITKSDRHVLFSNIEAVRDVSEQFMNELEAIWQEGFELKACLCDTVTEYASGPFEVYVKYCSNLAYQERRLKELKLSNPGFCEALNQLERDSACHSLPMQSFLSSPMQRITRFPLLVDSICHRMKYTDPYYRNVTDALHSLQKLVRKCNEGARQMENLEKINKIDSSLDFKYVKKMALVSQGRSLVKRGPLVHVLKEAEGLLIKKKKETLNLYLFNDILIITKKKSDGVYQVIDYSSRIHCHADFVDEEDVAKFLPHGLPTSCRHVFVMALLENHQKQHRDFFFACESESERMRWVEAVTPAQQVTDDEKIYEEWACPQVQAIHRYVATEPDELTLEESDVVNVIRKMKDGWYEGERMRDGERGWFPANHTVEILSERVRSRNLLQRYRLHTLHTHPTATGSS